MCVCVFILLGPLTLNLAWRLRCLGCQSQARILNETETPRPGVAQVTPPDPFLFPHLHHATTAKLETPPSSAGRAAGSSGEAVLPSPIIRPPRAREHFPIGSWGDGVPFWRLDPLHLSHLGGLTHNP